MLVASEAPVDALHRVCRLTGGELAGDLGRALARERSGEPLTPALGEQTTLEPFARFVQGLIVAIERGTPLADVLYAQALDVRELGKRALLDVGAVAFSRPHLGARLGVGLITFVPLLAYYLAVRVLEQRWPQLGWLLGTPTKPATTSTSPRQGHGHPAVRTAHHQLISPRSLELPFCPARLATSRAGGAFPHVRSGPRCVGQYCASWLRSRGSCWAMVEGG